MRSASSIVALALATVLTTDAFVPGVVRSPVHAGLRLVGDNKQVFFSKAVRTPHHRELCQPCYGHTVRLDVPYIQAIGGFGTCYAPKS